MVLNLTYVRTIHSMLFCALHTYLQFPVVFERLTEKHLPDLYDLLKNKLKILEMISLGWFLTLFLSVLDSSVAVNIIDCFFISGAKVQGSRVYIGYVCMYVRYKSKVKIKFPFCIHRTLLVLSFEPCHLHLVLSTCPTIMFFDLVILTATTTRVMKGTKVLTLSAHNLEKMMTALYPQHSYQ